MFSNAYDFKTFYNSREGRVVRRILQSRILELWPDCKGLHVLGSGYASPYMRAYMDAGNNSAERISVAMPAGKSAHPWPPEGSNKVFLSESAELPIETNSVDRILMVHDLEFAEFLEPKLQEAWRVLKSNGRALIIVPNRAGFWARQDWSPLGHGVPFSLGQIRHQLRDSLFVEENTQEALFMPPLRLAAILKSAGMFEQVGRKMPIAAGVHMVEVSKQLYARATPPSGSKVLVRGRGGLMPKPVPSAFKRDIKSGS